MTSQEWQIKFTHLLSLSEKYVHYQKRYEAYHAEADKRQMHHYRREIEKLSETERKRMNSKQGELL